MLNPFTFGFEVAIGMAKVAATDPERFVRLLPDSERWQSRGSLQNPYSYNDGRQSKEYAELMAWQNSEIGRAANARGLARLAATEGSANDHHERLIARGDVIRGKNVRLKEDDENTSRQAA